MGHARSVADGGGVRRWARWWADDPLPLDLCFYLACLAYAVVVACTNEFYGYRVWGNFAIAGYGAGLVHTLWLLVRVRRGRGRDSWWHSRWVGIGAVGVLAMLAPLAMLVIRRLTGRDWLTTPFSWSAQPEVWVIERSAALLLDTGTPYVNIAELGRVAVVNDYTPYGPVMALFGIPRALFGGTPLTDALTDARWYFALAFAGCVLASLRLLGRPPVPPRAAQLAMAFPLTALTWAVAGPDLAILGLLVLAGALATRERPVASACVLALAVSAKLIAVPAAVVLAVLVGARGGVPALGRFAGTLVAICAAVNVPVVLVDPAAFVEHVLKFPSGLGAVSSPAASPLPGHLIASIGPAGKVITFVLLAGAAVAILVWLLARPPVTTSDAILRIAAGLGAFTLLAPATRFGYLVYPTVLLGAMLCFRGAERHSDSLSTQRQ